MTYDRLKAKPIQGEHCPFCGDSSVPLVKTPCCNQWICCDTAYVSFRGGERCQNDHEQFSLCYSHYVDGHSGPWQSCQTCKEYWDSDEYEELSKNSSPNF